MFDFELEAKTAEEVNGLADMKNVRKRIAEYSKYDGLTRSVLRLAQMEGLSGEDTYTLLAYHALVTIKKSQKAHKEHLDMCVGPPRIGAASDERKGT